MKNSYSTKDKLLIMLKLFIKGLAVSVPFFFTHSYLATIISLFIGLFIAKDIFDTVKEEFKRNLLLFILCAYFGSYLAGILFGFSCFLLSFGIYKSYTDLFWISLILSLIILISCFVMSIRLKYVWDLQNEKEQLDKRFRRRIRRKFGVKLPEDIFKS